MSGKPYVISFTNQKGGVGKTTSCVNIAAYLGIMGYKVLLCDIDPQGNSTSGVGVSKKSVEYSVYDALLGECEPSDCIIKTDYDNLYCLPATISLAGAEIDLLQMEKRETRLKEFFNNMKSSSETDYDFDFIVIDCPPSLGLLTINALTASNSIIIPMQCEYYALEGLSQLMITLSKIKKLHNPSLSILGILITMYNPRLTLTSQVLDELKKYYSDKLFTNMIPRAVKLTEAPSYGEPACYHDKFGKGTQAYNSVCDEILRRTGTKI